LLTARLAAKGRANPRTGCWGEAAGLDVAVYPINSRGVRVLDELLSDSVQDPFLAGSRDVVLRVPAVLNVVGSRPLAAALAGGPRP
jgi:hypothetical protein